MILFSQQLTLTHNNKVVYHVLVSQKGNRHKRKNKDTEIINLPFMTFYDFFYQAHVSPGQTVRTSINWA